jgi:hypothetical protein
MQKPQEFLQYQRLWDSAKNICANGKKRFLIKKELKNNEDQILKNF